MTDQTTAELIAEARLWPRDGVNEGRLINSLADALEAAEKRAEKRAEENRKESDRLSRELQVAEDQANTIAGDLAQAERERDNWKLSAEEATRAEKRWKDRAVEAERELSIRSTEHLELVEAVSELQSESELWRVRQAAEYTKRAHDQLAAIVEQARLYCENQGDKFRHHAGRILDMLAASPADALREHEAALIEGLADEIAVEIDADAPDDFLRGFDAGSDAVYAALREKARQRREEQDRG